MLNLYGQAASTPQYAIHEEDRLEWMHALLSDRASLPDWVSYQLKEHPLLYIGCEIPDWLGRFLLRMSSNSRLSMERIPFFLAGCSASREPSLSSFFTTYCRKTLVQQLDMEPTEFVAELRARWQKQAERETHPRWEHPMLRPGCGHTDDLHQLHAGRRGRRPAGVRRDHEPRR